MVIKQTGTVPQKLTAIGGGAAPEFWLMALATILNILLEVLALEGEFGAALGAARVAIVAVMGCCIAETCGDEDDLICCRAAGAIRKRISGRFSELCASEGSSKMGTS